MKKTKIKIKSALDSQEKKVFFDREGGLEEITAVLAKYYDQLGFLCNRLRERKIRLFINFDVFPFVDKKKAMMPVIIQWNQFFFKHIDPTTEGTRSIHFEIKCDASNAWEERQRDICVYSMGIEFIAMDSVIRYEILQYLGTDTVTFLHTIDKTTAVREMYSHLNGALEAQLKFIRKTFDGSLQVGH